LVFLGIIEYRYSEEKHQYQYDMCSNTYSKIDDAPQVYREGTAPHKGENNHNEHAAGWVRDMS